MFSKYDLTVFDLFFSHNLAKVIRSFNAKKS